MRKSAIIPIALAGLFLSATAFSQDNAEPPSPKKEDRRENKRPPKRPEAQLKAPTVSESIDSEACSRVRASVGKAGFTKVTVTCDKTYAYVQSDTYPDHSLMNGITGTNEQIPVPALNYAAPILLNPEISDTKTSIDAALGVAINGVPIYDYSAQGEIDLHGYDATKDTTKLGQLDECGGHAGRGDDYHYHAKPTCMIDSMKNVTDATIIGWGYDGFPLYGDANPDGSAVTKGDLDVCNGQSDKQFGYRYHTSVEAPYIIQCLVGKVDTSILPRVAPLKGAAARADLRPPREGVENLKHVKKEDGTRTLNYTYKGTEYYTRFKPSESKANCYDFEQKTISNNGAVESGTYCR
ncbi:YHYH protein [uncultured Cocleimonas sp.]|uniref:YHYH protein n=1 Tax=uncultured Cocleimonas sp. TaxID=1051587 RepID=UPI00262907A6|nr:YHYH protein [uncultured Cocleimonas sp.]